MTATQDDVLDQTICAWCETSIADGQGELLMGTRWRTWIVCRSCAKAGPPAGGSPASGDRPGAKADG